MIAALYVDTKKGPYEAMTDVDAWGVERDARLYEGPGPVIAHPPCKSYGRFAWKATKEFHDCGPRAVQQVRTFGGVLEHPHGSLLWEACDMPRPGDPFDRWGGFTVVVNQCDWGHKCQKRTWLYIVAPKGIVEFSKPDPREPTHVMGVSYAKGRTKPLLPKSQRHITPPAFAEFLVGIARQCAMVDG